MFRLNLDQKKTLVLDFEETSFITKKLYVVHFIHFTIKPTKLHIKFPSELL